MPRLLSTPIYHLETLAVAAPVPEVLSLFGVAAAGFFACGWLAWQAAEPFYNRWERQQWAAMQKEIQHLRAMTWQQFEVYAAAAFERAGWAVTVTGGGGADDGVDLMLTKGRGLRVVVSCKHYRARLGVPQVREVVGVAYHYKARGAYVVALGGFTKAAREYADGKPIKLIDGAALLRWMNKR
ncbi:restriction endonuclease [Microvirga sesbaniae]|uniref:restriction endonuclease n=1 Tax=Microvirga sesbaniae TaxID=681392 RepID=UPI0021C796AF|nr:restriction endonuclease [Microvirga sp. HBU67692]